MHMRLPKQKQRDEDREVFALTFPVDLQPEQVTAWLRSIIETLVKRTGSSFNRETIVFETWSDSREIIHRLLVSKSAAPHITQQLRTHGRGMTVVKDDKRPTPFWTTGVELGMTSPTRQLSISTHADISSSILGSLQSLKDGEIALVQWIIGPAPQTKQSDPRSAEFSIMRTLAGYSAALKDELDDRAAKLSEPNVLAVCRVMAKGTVERATALARNVQDALGAANSSSNRFSPTKTAEITLSENANEAATPLHFPAQLNITELSALIAWKIGGPHVAGLAGSASRQLAATEMIPRVGRMIGTSNFPGAARPIAISREESLKHLHVLGPTGAGKTTLLSNLIAADMEDGYGVIVIEAKGDLFRDTLNRIPTSRLADTIILDVNEHNFPVGFNILEQGSAGAIIDQLTELFYSLYPETRGVWMRELLYHGLHTLAEQDGMTFVDLDALVSPRSKLEIAWASNLRKSVKNPEVRDFWERWGELAKNEQERNASPLHNRIWQLSSRPELRNIIGQSKSTFYMDDVIREGKVLLINLAGVPKEAASIAGTLIMNAVWSSVQRVKSEKANYLYVDEFQDFIRLPVGAEDMLAKARGFGLAFTLAHQHLGQLTDDIEAAVMANARSKIVFGLESADDAKRMQKSFGGDAFTDHEFLHLAKYEAVAKIATSNGSSLATLTTLAPSPTTGNRDTAIKQSRATYGRSVDEVKDEIASRRVSETPTPEKRLPLGIREWDE